MKRDHVVFGTACFMIIGWLLAGVPAHAAIFNVSTVDGIRDALTTAASNGEDDMVNIAAGTYLLDATLAFESDENYFLQISGAGKGSTLLDGGNSVQALSLTTYQPDAHIAIDSLTLQNSTSAQSGGALHISTEAANITVSNCEVLDSSVMEGESIGGGAALLAQTGVIRVASSDFRRNRSDGNVGGLYLGTTSGTLHVTNNTFSGNVVNNTGESETFGDGGGAMASSNDTAHAFFSGNTFEDNTASGGSNPDGGGLMIYLLGTDSSASVTNNSFSNNTAGLGGGGLFLRFNASGEVTVRGNTFTGNQAQIGSGGGALLYVDDGTLTYERNTHTDEQAGENGGGAWINLLAGTGEIRENTFRNNQCAENGGGLSATTNTASMSIARNIFHENEASNVGGGLSWADSEGSLNTLNNTFFNNSATNGGGGVYVYLDQSAARATLVNNIFWNDSEPAFAYSYGSGSGELVLTYSTVQNGAEQPWFGTGCIVENPLFRDPDNGDFRLTWTNFPESEGPKSPCIDSGDPTSPQDPDGTRADMGAIYFPQSAGAIPTLSEWGVIVLAGMLLVAGAAVLRRQEFGAKM